MGQCLSKVKEYCSQYRLKVEQGVHRLGLGIVVLSVHISPVLGPPFRDNDGQRWRRDQR